MNITPTKVIYSIWVCTSQFNSNTSGQITFLQMPLHRNIALSGPVITQSNTTWKWRQNGRNGVSNHQPHDCLINRLFRRRSQKTSKFRVTGLCVGNSPVTGEFSTQMASNAENVSISWRHHEHHILHSTTIVKGEHWSNFALPQLPIPRTHMQRLLCIFCWNFRRFNGTGL